MQNKKIVIIAGEESGDFYAANLIKQLKSQFPNIDISGIGGKHMRDAGAKLLYNLADYGVTGITEVFKFLRQLHQAFSLIKTHLNHYPTDLLLLIDYPGFNLRLAKYAKRKLNIKIYYYISPQIWAWKAKRINLIKECVDHMAVIFPFEKTIYQNAGIPVSFVGHPLVSNMKSKFNMLELRAKLKLPPTAQIIALLPGSRNNEVSRHMPILQKTAVLLNKQLPNLYFIIPIARTIATLKITSFFRDTNLNICFFEDRAQDCIAAADFVIVASGTASLECALLEKPMCIIYKSSILTYIMAMWLMKIKFLGLCNIIANKMIAPEFLQYDCNPQELAKYFLSFQKNTQQPHRMISQLKEVKQSLITDQADQSLLSLIYQEFTSTMPSLFE